MPRSSRLVALAALGLTLATCAAPRREPLVDPFPLRFPLAEAGALDIGGRIAGQPWARDGIVHFVTSDGSQTAIVVSSRTVLWRRPAAEIQAGMTGISGPEAPNRTFFRAEAERLRAFDIGNKLIWEFVADGRITAELSVSSGRVYFGTENRRFYCLRKATGKPVWSRRLQGAPLHPAVVQDGTVVVPASNSVVYFLSARGGSILSWETIPSRVVFPLAAAGPLVLVSSASRDVLALEIKTGKRVGQHEASGPLVAGAVWSSPYVVLFVEDAGSGRQRIFFLRSR